MKTSTFILIAITLFAIAYTYDQLINIYWNEIYTMVLWLWQKRGIL